MPQLDTATGLNFFRVYVRGWNTLYDEIERESQQYVQEQLALGRTPKEILLELEQSRDNGLGLFRRFAGRVESRMDLGINVTFQLSSNRPVETATMYEWKLDPFAEHCDSCLAQSKMGPRPFDEIPYPSSQPTIGKTNCEAYCKCQLVPVESK